jgi:hypothetical protein
MASPDEELDRLLQSAERVISGSAFASFHSVFVARHCQHFEVGEENPLICTEIHQSYQEGAETHLERELGRAAVQAISNAIATLGRESAVEVLNRESAAEAVDKLTSLTDYQTFKEIMLVAKAEAATPERDRSRGDQVQRAAAAGIVGASWDDEVFSSLPELSEPPSAANGWVRTLETADGALISERKVTEDGSLLMRVTFAAGDLSVEEGARMMVDWTNERVSWDGMLRASRVHAEERDASGLITGLTYTQTMSIPFLARLGGIPSDFDMRLRAQRDWPERGSIAWALTPWDVAAGCVDANNKYMKGGMGVARTGSDGGVVVTLFEKNSVAWIPSFLMNRMIKTQILGNLQRYRAYLGK